jgi:hypothetical protein
MPGQSTSPGHNPWLDYFLELFDQLGANHRENALSEGERTRTAKRSPPRELAEAVLSRQLDE